MPDDAGRCAVRVLVVMRVMPEERLALDCSFTSQQWRETYSILMLVRPERQAEQVPATDPAAQPGIAQPGMGAESSGGMPMPPGGAGGLRELLGSL